MGQHILLFESDSAFAQEIQANFERLGATVDVANDGPRGLDLASAQRPDLILLSIELPGMNGFLVCKKIKKQDDLSAVPLLILSSEATEDVFEQHRKLRTRADDYIHKPIAFVDLLDRVKRFVAFEANGNGVSADAGEEAIEISDLDDEEVILVADEDSSDPDDGASDARAFAEQAVDMLTAEPEAKPPSQRPPVPTRRISVPAEETRATAPDPITAVSSLDGPAAEELGLVQHELAQVKARAAELEAELGRAVRRAEQAVEEEKAAKSRASTAERTLTDTAKKGGVSSREFLDLREQLNRKDRELLGLRDQVSARDKQLVEASDRNLTLERELADVADKHVDMQRDLDKATETVEALQADKAGEKKRLDDLKARLERAESRSRELSEELGGINAANAKELEALQRRHAEAVATADQRHAQAVEALLREHGAALEGLRKSHADELATLKEEHAQALAAARDQAEHQRQAFAGQLRGEAEVELQRRLAEVQRNHEALISQALEAHEKELSSTRSSLQEQHAAELRAAADRLQQESSRLARALADAETRQQLLQDQLEEAETSRTDAMARIGRMSTDRDRATELGQALKAQLDRLSAQRTGEVQVVDRARTALGIALSLLEEHRGGSSGEAES